MQKDILVGNDSDDSYKIGELTTCPIFLNILNKCQNYLLTQAEIQKL